jgi:hypothetical protein
MFSQYFGQYLLNKGILPVEQLRDAIEQERLTKAKLGVLAMNAGFMTALQVEEVHNLQRSMDRRFGEIAVSKGYLTEERVNTLLSEQSNSSLSLGQVVVEKGYLTYGQLEKALADYKSESNLSGAKFDGSLKDDMEGIIKSSFSFLAGSAMGEIYGNYVALFLRNINRLLNDVPVLDSSVVRPLGASESIDGWLVTQKMAGSDNLLTGMVLDDTVLLELARRFSEEDLQSIDSLTQDSAAEFLNVHNGIFIINMSNRGVKLELGAPSIVQESKIAVHSGYRMSLQLSFGKIDLVLGKID